MGLKKSHSYTVWDLSYSKSFKRVRPGVRGQAVKSLEVSLGSQSFISEAKHYVCSFSQCYSNRPRVDDSRERNQVNKILFSFLNWIGNKIKEVAGEISLSFPQPPLFSFLFPKKYERWLNLKENHLQVFPQKDKSRNEQKLQERRACWDFGT